MNSLSRGLSKTFRKFLDSQQASGILLILCTMASLLLANSTVRVHYLGFWRTHVGSLSVEDWINDGLMAVFFLLVGLEIERELYHGELSDLKNALLPIVAAVGGVITPALIHFSLNIGTQTQSGVAIPMATDIAFTLGVLALLGSRVPASLKVFVTAFAVIDDLIAVVIIAIFYATKLSVFYLAGALAIWAALVLLNRAFKVISLAPYLIGGALMWFLTLKSGVHATVAGVLLAFAIPFSARAEDANSPSHRLEHFLHKPVAFGILPLFALANTGVVIGTDWAENLRSANSLGIIVGLIAGKSVGITLLSYLAVKTRICQLPSDLNWKYVFGAGLLGGIGFTMSIFITNLAFPDHAEIVNASKLAILLASLTAGAIGFLWLRTFVKPNV